MNKTLVRQEIDEVRKQSLENCGIRTTCAGVYYSSDSEEVVICYENDDESENVDVYTADDKSLTFIDSYESQKEFFNSDRWAEGAFEKIDV